MFHTGYHDINACCVDVSVAKNVRQFGNIFLHRIKRPGEEFPQIMRKLFARTFYRMEKDIAKLADILGHSSINTTRIYIMSTGTEHRRRMENMHLIL